MLGDLVKLNKLEAFILYNSTVQQPILVWDKQAPPLHEKP